MYLGPFHFISWLPFQRVGSLKKKKRGCEPGDRHLAPGGSWHLVDQLACATAQSAVWMDEIRQLLGGFFHGSPMAHHFVSNLANHPYTNYCCEKNDLRDLRREAFAEGNTKTKRFSLSVPGIHPSSGACRFCPQHHRTCTPRINHLQPTGCSSPPSLTQHRLPRSIHKASQGRNRQQARQVLE